MKKLISLTLVPLFAFSLSGCADSAPESEKAKPSSSSSSSTPSKPADCKKASQSVISTINTGLKANDGIEAEKDYKDVLENAYIKKSDVNELWYVAGKTKLDKLNAVWIITKEDGKGLTISLNEGAKTVSNYPKASETPAFKDVADPMSDVVQAVSACVD